MADLKDIETGIARLSVWIDEPSAAQDPLTQLLLRVGKLTEESGEVWDAIIGSIGQNPRKGVYKTWDDVDKELLDVIVTAWGALEHRHGNRGVVGAMLSAFVARLLHRAGLEPVGGPALVEGDRVRVLAWDNRQRDYTDYPETPCIGTVRYAGTNAYAGQPSVQIDGTESGFAARWERG